MRKIKFRGKRVDNGEWVYGGVEQNSITIIYDDTLPYDNENLVYKETVGQFTSRIDDGGDELYDGDIISFDYELKSFEGVIEWSEALSAFVVKRKDEDPLFLYDIDDAVTKLGNVYDID